MTKKIYNEDEAKSIKERKDNIKSISVNRVRTVREKLNLIAEEKRLMDMFTL